MVQRSQIFKQRSDSGDPAVALNKLACCLCGFMYSAKKGRNKHKPSQSLVCTPRCRTRFSSIFESSSFLSPYNFYLHDCTLGSERCRNSSECSSILAEHVIITLHTTFLSSLPTLCCAKPGVSLRGTTESEPGHHISTLHFLQSHNNPFHVSLLTEILLETIASACLPV